MDQTTAAIWRTAEKKEFIHAAQTAIAAIASLLIARLFRLPETYWAVIATLIVMQSSLGAALKVSRQRLAGTALGCSAGALLAMYFKPTVLLFGAGVFILGVICGLLHIDRPAYRYAGITLAVVLLIPRSQSPWTTAFHRFAEISIGIAVGLVVTAVWPEKEPAPA
jgi:uncharacterized membrane protein YccC